MRIVLLETDGRKVDDEAEERTAGPERAARSR